MELVPGQGQRKAAVVLDRGRPHNWPQGKARENCMVLDRGRPQNWPQGKQEMAKNTRVSTGTLKRSTILIVGYRLVVISPLEVVACKTPQRCHLD